MSLENWMRDLPPPLRDFPVIYLAIPGSHDSMTYRITSSSGLAPDADPTLKRLYPLFGGTIRRWTITQNLDVTQQLQVGIRYFDLRVATKNGTDSLYFTHGLYAGEISDPLKEIVQFLETHPNEVVFLDFQHFYSFTAEDHRMLIRYLLNLYGPRLVPRQRDVSSVTLNSMARLRQQIIIVYRHNLVYTTGELWPPQTLMSPWPKQDTTEGLLNFLNNVKRHSGVGFVHQAVLTPTPYFIALRWTSNLRDKCAKPVLKDVIPKLSEFSPGPPPEFGVNGKAPVNVVIADFVDLEDSMFSKTVIQLNLKLLNNAPEVTG